VSIAVPGTAVLDIALSVAAEGRVAQAQERGEMLPAGWIMDAEGAPSCDPADYLGADRCSPSADTRATG
jgi:(2R)-3-sulfolactate dehydrogenase (NADP+)